MTNIEIIREKFEETSIPNFSIGEQELERFKQRLSNGSYLNPTIGDHWQTFQEGWEECLKYIKEQND